MARYKKDQPCTSKRNIIQAAKKLFAERGYDNVTVDDIAAECGLTKGSFYYHFKSKKELVYQIHRYRYSTLHHDLLADHTMTGLQKLDEYLARYFQYLDDDGVNILRSWLMQNIDPSARESLYGDNDPAAEDVQYYVSFLEQAQDDGEVSKDAPVNQLAQQIIIGLGGYCLNWCASEKTFPTPADFHDEYVSILFGSLLKPYLTELGESVVGH